MMLTFQATRTFPVGGGDNNGTHFANVDGGDSGGELYLENDSENTGKYKGKKKKKAYYECGSKSHLIKDCPVAKEKREATAKESAKEGAADGETTEKN